MFVPRGGGKASAAEGAQRDSKEARSRRLRGSLDWSEAERRGAVRPADQAEAEGKRASGQTAAQRDSEEARSARADAQCDK